MDKLRIVLTWTLISEKYCSIHVLIFYYLYGSMGYGTMDGSTTWVYYLIILGIKLNKFNFLCRGVCHKYE